MAMPDTTYWKRALKEHAVLVEDKKSKLAKAKRRLNTIDLALAARPQTTQDAPNTSEVDDLWADRHLWAAEVRRLETELSVAENSSKSGNPNDVG